MPPLYPKKYITETWKSYKHITIPGTDKVTTQKLKFPKGIRFGVGGVTPEYDSDDIIMKHLAEVFRNSKDMEPKAHDMKIDWMKDVQTIHITFIYPKKHVHYFFRWWLDAKEVPDDDEEGAENLICSY
jgi:hypothetical protein